MGGFFGVASKEDCVFDLYFGIDYHSHLGTRRGGMAVLGERGFNRAIHNIENSPFRTKFDKDFQEMEGNFGIGCISDYESQPLIIRSIHGTYALTTISKINNMDELTHDLYKHGHTHFQEMSGGDINATELVATLIDQKDNLIEGINYALEKIDGSLSLLLMNSQGIYAARDKRGRTPVVIGRKKDSFCASFENFAYKNLGFSDYKELGPGEIVVLTPKNCVTLSNPNSDMKICTFLWVYYGYPASSYEGISVEKMRYNCGERMAQRDNVLSQLMMAFFTLIDNYLNSSLPQIAHYQKLLELREEIYAFPARPWSIQELADQVSLSPAYFQDLYKKAFQVSCGADIIQSRIGQAKRMLAQTNLTMEEIADRCGYNSPVHFSRQFRKCTGYAPSKWRENALGENMVVTDHG